jgi:hypothetical protein
MLARLARAASGAMEGITIDLERNCRCNLRQFSRTLKRERSRIYACSQYYGEQADNCRHCFPGSKSEERNDTQRMWNYEKLLTSTLGFLTSACLSTTELRKVIARRLLRWPIFTTLTRIVTFCFKARLSVLKLSRLGRPPAWLTRQRRSINKPPLTRFILLPWSCELGFVT